MRWILQDLLSFKPNPLPFLPKTHPLLFVLVGHQASNMAPKLVRHSHLQILSSSISINNHIRSPHFSNPNRAPLNFSYRLFSNASSSSSTRGFQRASSLKDLELAKFAFIAETWSDFLFPHFFFHPLFGWWGKTKGKWKCKVEFIQPSCWLYSVPNLLVFQQLVTLYLSGFVVRVVSEIECWMLKSVQENRVSRLDLVGDSWLQAARSNTHAKHARSWSVMVARALRDKIGQLAVLLSRGWISRLSQVASHPCFEKPDVSHSLLTPV